jgi:hypothetical protein
MNPQRIVIELLKLLDYTIGSSLWHCYSSSSRCRWPWVARCCFSALSCTCRVKCQDPFPIIRVCPVFRDPGVTFLANVKILWLMTQRRGARSLLFWAVTQSRLVVTDVSGPPVRSIFKWQAVQSAHENAWLLTMGPIGCSETSVTTNLRCLRSQKSECPIYTAAQNLKSTNSPFAVGLPVCSRGHCVILIGEQLLKTFPGGWKLPQRKTLIKSCVFSGLKVGRRV